MEEAKPRSFGMEGVPPKFVHGGVVRYLPALLAAVLALSAGWGPAPRASEPGGFVLLRSEWVSENGGILDRAPREGVARLRVHVRPATSLRETVLTLVPPSGVTVDVPADLPAGESPERRRMGTLSSPGEAVAEFLVRIEPNGGGTADLVLEALGPGDRPIREAAGVPVGAVPAGRLHHGAVEFSAVKVPERQP